MKNEIAIQDRMIGDGHPCYIIAEIGSNHNNDWQLALKTIDAAVDAGVDAVKFQTFKATKHISSLAKTPSYLKTERKLQDIIADLEINRDWHRPLMEYCVKKGVAFFSSPCDFEAVDQLEEVGAPAHKVASFDLPDTSLIRHIAKTGKPIIVSTGLADWMEIQRAVDTCRSVGNDKIFLLQCTSLYPAPINLTNLRAMATMRSAFQVLTGYSDHTIGDTAACASVALGSCMIEKHLTLDRSLPGPDHPFAAEPHEMKVLVQRVRDVEAALGDGVKNGPRPAEKEMFDTCRRSLHANCKIPAGSTITDAMLTVKRPGIGIQPFLRQQLVGRVAKKEIPADSWITWDML